MGVGMAIPRNVAGKFGRPPLAVVRWLGGMRRATVPEASINHHGDFRSGEEQIGATPGQPRERGINAVPQPASVQVTAEKQLGLCVARSLS